MGFPALFELENISKDYQVGNNIVHALTNISLEFQKNEFVAIWGPSGSGKTTLLNILGSLDSPSQGRIALNNTFLDQLSDNQKAKLRNTSIGFIFQRFNLIPVLSALENVMLPLEFRGVRESEAKKQAEEYLEKVGLSNYKRHRPDNLSGGQQQRVAIARALIIKPQVVLADEPTANLDSHTAQEIINQMANLNAEEGTTFIFSTHDQNLLKQVKRKVKLEDGMVKE